MNMWQGLEITKLSDLVLLQAYNTCIEQEQKRIEASQNEKFNSEIEINGKKRKPMAFAPTNPTFLELKQELLNEVNKRKLI